MKKNIPQLAALAGIALLIVSLIWWQQTFGVKVGYLRCLALSDGICHVSSIGKIFGGAGYNPIIFWIAVVCLVAGIVLNKLRIF
jgi:fucose 4-O-acetylase-like acetyltransferase